MGVFIALFGIAAAAQFPTRVDLVVFTTVVWSLLFARLAPRGYLPSLAIALLLYWTFIYADLLNFGLRPRHVGAYTGLFGALLLVGVVLHQAIPRRAGIVAILTMCGVNTALLMIGALYIAHNWVLGAPVTRAEFYAIYQTDVREAIEFVSTVGSVRHLIPAAIAATMLGWLVYLQQRTTVQRIGRLELALLAALSLTITYHYRASLGVIELITSSASSYRHELTTFRQLRDLRATGNIPVVASKASQGETYVLVLGESLNRNHMQIYGYHRSTTPLLDSILRTDGLLKFEHAYATHTHTMPVLSSALTSANQRNGAEPFAAPSLIDVANAAGFETYWITNQVLYGPWDNAVSVLAHAADSVVSLNRGIGATTRTSHYDGKTVRVLEDILASRTDRNRLLVVHLMGSHPRYCSRFPDSFTVFRAALVRGEYGQVVDKDADRLTDWVNCYDNSVLYNDHVVANLLHVTQRIGGASAFYYFADHGQDVIGGNLHHSSRFVFPMVEIPMLAWFSEAYRSMYPDRYASLAQKSEETFPTDFLFDTAVGIAGIETPEYDASADLSASSYRTDDVGLRLLSGQRSLLEPENLAYHQRRNIRRLQQLELDTRVIPHRVNSTGKLARVLYDGYRALELDLLFRSAPEGGRFELGHGETTLSGNDLADVLVRMPQDEMRKLWFDVKNLGAANAAAIRAELLRLDDLHDLKPKVIFESPDVARLRGIGEAGFHTSYYLPTDRLVRLLEAQNRDSMRVEANMLAQQIARAGPSAVSFDARLYPFVKRELEPLLDAQVVYHTWELNLALGDPDFLEKVRGHRVFADPRVQTILVKYHSEFGL